MKIKELVFEKDIDYVGQEIFVAKGILNDFVLKKNLNNEKSFYFLRIDNAPIGQFEFEQAKQEANKRNEEKYYFMKDLLKQWEAE